MFLLYSVAVSGQEKQVFFLPEAREQILIYVESLLPENAKTGHYKIKPAGQQDIYACIDAAIIYEIVGINLKQEFTGEERNEWIRHINSFANKDGTYNGNRSSFYHRNSNVIAALALLGGKQKNRVSLYKDLDEVAEIAPWLEQVDWVKQWGASHAIKGGILCYSMSSRCTEEWKTEVFRWLDANLDPKSGYWRVGVLHHNKYQGVGGGSHIWPLYQHLEHTFPYPEKVIDEILKLQKPTGSFIDGEKFTSSFFDLDALYGLWYMKSLTPDYRKLDIKKAADNLGNFWITNYKSFLESDPDMHAVVALAGTFGLLQKMLPCRFYDEKQWSDIFSDIRFYRTDLVEKL